MGSRFGYWVIGLFVVAMLVGVGAYTYNLGVAQGIAEGARVAAPAAGAVVVPPMYWYRPWGFGFFPFFPLLFILFFAFMFRGFCGRARWYGRGYREGGVPPAFEEWHRRAHDNLKPNLKSEI